MIVRTFKHYTSISCALSILKSGYFETNKKLNQMNDLSEKQLLDKIATASKIYGFCFSLRKNESIPMWKMYSNKRGCLLYFQLKNNVTYDQVFKNFKVDGKNNKYGKINYKKIKDFNKYISNPNMISNEELFLVKRSDFDFENEYRFVSTNNRLCVDFSKCKKITIFYNKPPTLNITHQIKKLKEKLKVDIKLTKSSILQIYKNN